MPTHEAVKVKSGLHWRSQNAIGAEVIVSQPGRAAHRSRNSANEREKCTAVNTVRRTEPKASDH